MKRFFKIIPFVAFLLTAQSCGNVKTVSQLVTLGIKVVQLLSECTDLSQKFTGKVSEVSSVMQQGISSNKDVVELASYWGKYWNNIHSDYDDLVAKLNQTNQTSSEYFAELENNNSKISNNVIKEEDAKKTIKLKADYQAEYVKALTSLNNAQKLLKDGDDMMYVLRNEVLRSRVQENIAMLKSISSQANLLSSNISNFSTNCIPLFQKK